MREREMRRLAIEARSAGLHHEEAETWWVTCPRCNQRVEITYEQDGPGVPKQLDQAMVQHLSSGEACNPTSHANAEMVEPTPAAGDQPIPSESEGYTPPRVFHLGDFDG